jgi:hypothetical protein
VLGDEPHPCRVIDPDPISRIAVDSPVDLDKGHLKSGSKHSFSAVASIARTDHDPVDLAIQQRLQSLLFNSRVAPRVAKQELSSSRLQLPFDRFHESGEKWVADLRKYEPYRIRDLSP